MIGLDDIAAIPCPEGRSVALSLWNELQDSQKNLHAMQSSWSEMQSELNQSRDDCNKYRSRLAMFRDVANVLCDNLKIEAMEFKARISTPWDTERGRNER